MGIAKHGFQPWNIPADEHYFLDQTAKYGGNVLMGRKTFEVIGHPLSGRRNFVASHQAIDSPGIEMIREISEFINNFEEDIWVIGGATIFDQTIMHANELYLTFIDADFGCDKFFPEFEPRFKLAAKSDLHEENGFIFTYRVYKS